MALDATLGGASANSYVSVEEAKAYWSNKFQREAWTDLERSFQAVALMEATELLEGLRFWGRPVSSEQALAFPRVYEPASDGTSIPRQIVSATCILALELAQKEARKAGGSGAGAGAHNVTAVEEMKAAGVERFKMADYEVAFGSAASSGGVFGSLPLAVQNLVGLWVKKGAPITRGRRDPLYPPSLPWACR